MAVNPPESKQSVVWSKVCGFSGPLIMAASESEESHRAVGELLLSSPSPLCLPTLAACSRSSAGESVQASSFHPPTPTSPCYFIGYLCGFDGLRGGDNSPLPGNSLKGGSGSFSRYLPVVGKGITTLFLPFFLPTPPPPSHLVLPQGRST